MFEEGTRTEWKADPMLKLHRACFGRRPFLCLAASLAAYASVVLVFGERLGISSNYFVIVPVIVAALGYGLAGGIAAGALGLPGNLLLFHLLGHPEFSPASKLIAGITGIAIGAALGYLSEYFRQLQMEIERRVQTEKSLRIALEDNRMLLLELNHRVKNNLNVIKSLIQLQRNRSRDEAFLDASERLLNRVFAIARAHDRLYDQGELNEISPDDYLGDILGIYSQENSAGPRLTAELSAGKNGIPPDAAIPLGLILNETVSNALKYAFPPGAPDPVVRVRFAPEGERWVLEVRDNGRGFDAFASYPQGLGLRIVRGLATQLEGQVSWTQDGGTIFRLDFPRRRWESPADPSFPEQLGF